MDITHYGTDKFLSLIDCGPSKYALWRQLPSSYGSVAIVRILRLIFCERGVPSEILTDNEPTFKTKEIRSFLDSWGVQIRLRAAYYPEGNGIVERNHLTIKRIAERSKCRYRKHYIGTRSQPTKIVQARWAKYTAIPLV